MLLVLMKAMKILLLHPNFPAQFRHIATALAQDPRHQVVFGTQQTVGEIAGVTKVLYQAHRAVDPQQMHDYLLTMEAAVLQGQAMYRVARDLKHQGFVPDVVYSHTAWGASLFMRDIFPQAIHLRYFEWFYHARGTDSDFDPAAPMDVDTELRTRIFNAPILLELANCDRGLAPTIWQRYQHPHEFHRKIDVLHEGIDTNFFQPQPGAKLQLPDLDLSQVEEVVTYSTRGMEPHRGFPQFMAAVASIQQRRPNCHVVVVGKDEVCYGKRLPDGKTYKQQALESLDLDLSRLHFTGYLAYPQYLQVLQASGVHIYLTCPFVLSWSMLEAMATGCLVIGSDTPPVREVIKDGFNGLMVDFFSPQAIAERVDEVFDHPDRLAQVRAYARQTIVRHYNLDRLLPKQLQWIHDSLDLLPES
jgi:glycosyltransferase involved in cell wall biosynthesis